MVHTTYYYWYILVPWHTLEGMYKYRRKPNSTLHLITLCPPSSASESQQNAWLGLFAQFPSAWQSPPQSDHPGVACQSQSSTAKCWPHTRCCHACHLKLPSLHSPLGTLNPCACWTCNPFQKPIENVALSAKWNVHIWNRLWNCSGRLYTGAKDWRSS